MDKVIYNQHLEKMMKMVIYFTIRVDMVFQIQKYSVLFYSQFIDSFICRPFLTQGLNYWTIIKGTSKSKIVSKLNLLPIAYGL